MRIILSVFILTIAFSATALAQHHPSQYRGEEKRAIKSLSEQDVNAYLDGHGMALAKAAELNHYPGPRHVLELASELKLSDKQVADTKASFDRMHREATRLGALIVEKEKQLDNLFASKQIDSGRLKAVTSEIANLQGELRFVHLKAHLEMRQALTEEQVLKYDQLRGYKDGGHSHNDGEHKKR